MVQKITFLLVLPVLLILSGCGAKEGTVAKPSGGEAKYVTVQHILVAFSGSAPGKDIARTREEASQLAVELFRRANAGEDFDMLVEEYTDDSFPGVYQLANHKADPDPTRLILARSSMVPSFGDVAFSLGVGEIGLANYDKRYCKFGWHIIIRLE